MPDKKQNKIPNWTFERCMSCPEYDYCRDLDLIKPDHQNCEIYSKEEEE